MMDIQKLREEFEKLPEIADLIPLFDFSEDTNTYHIRYDDMDDDKKRLDVNYLGGAWYTYQEQQKKIDEIKAMAENWINQDYTYNSDSTDIKI